MRWLALHLPCLPLDALATSSLGLPTAVLAQRRVLLADAAAQQGGVQAGMSPATALSVLPALRLHPRNEAQEAALLQRLALALARYTPAIVLQGDGVWMEVSRTQRLFGGVHTLAQAVLATARDCGVSALNAAAAPTATAAGLRARLNAARTPLDALPLAPALAALSQPERLAQLLHGIGCRNLADVRALPRTGLQRRGGAALMQALARAYGEAPDPQTLFEPPREFSQGLELAHRADDAAMLVFAAQRLVQPLAGWLMAQWLAATRVSLHLRHERSLYQDAVPPTVVRIELGLPSRDAAQIMLLLRERLQRAALPAPVYAMTLTLDTAVAHAGDAAALWPELPDAQRDADGFTALLDRLTARLGAQQVQRIVLQADHRPEWAMQWADVAHPRSGFAAPPGAPGSGGNASGPAKLDPRRLLGQRADRLSPPRPTWLLPQPLPLGEHQGRPVHGGDALQLLTRAERIEAGWFDGQAVARDYHVASGADQRWRWVFKERRGVSDVSDPAPHWFLHGVFG
jgi:protein ImuB